MQTWWLLPMLLFGMSRAANALEWQLSWRTGPVDGYTQTPSGGEPGSSSLQRPSFAELGYDDAHSPRLAMHGSTGAQTWQLQAERIRLDGHNRLQHDLITHGETLAAGSIVDASLQFDWYGVGLGRTMVLAPDWQLAFALDAVWFDFHSTIQSDELSTGRSYNSKGVRAGFNVRYALTDTIALQASWYRGYRAAHWTAIDESSLALEWLLSPATLVLNVGAFALRYQDHQELPNRLLFEQPETLAIGLRWRF